MGHRFLPDEQRRGSKIGNETVARNAVLFYKKFMPLFKQYRKDGLSSKQIAERLNDIGHRTVYGKLWKNYTVNNLFRKIDEYDKANVKNETRERISPESQEGF